MIGWAIDALLASSLLMLVVLALRAPVRRVFGPGVAYALWLLPAARLMLPPLPASWREEAAAPIARASQGIDVLVIEPVTTRLPALTPAATSAQSWLSPTLLLAIWAAGAVAFLLWHLLAYRRFCTRVLAGAHSVDDAPVAIIESSAAAGPLAFGVWRRYVAFPADFRERYDADERALALEHELAHHAGGDLIANWLALAVLAVHWFNPIAWYGFRAFRADQEMACDARVLARRDPALRHAYGRAIVKSAHGGLLGGRVSAACHLHTINDLKGRLRMLSKFRKSRLRLAGGSVSVIAITLAGLGLTASGGQAAERLRARVDHTIGVDIAQLDAAVAAAPAAPAVPATPGVGAATAPAAPAVPELADDQATTVPVPPSSAAPTPPPPPAHPDIYVEPPAAPAPPAPGDKVERRVIIRHGDRAMADGTTVQRQIRIIRRDKDGHVISDETRGMPDIPEVSSANCGPGDGHAGGPVVHNSKDGKRIIVICTDRIERMADHAAMMAGNSKEIERHAYEAALRGLQASRARLTGKGDEEARKGIDEAIAELQADLAKLN